MKWHYSKRGDSKRRGIVDDDGLAALVQSRELTRKDLVFSEATGHRWVSAATVEGLFADIPEESLPSPTPVADAGDAVPDPRGAGEVASGVPGRETRSRGKSMAGAAVIAVVAIVAFVIFGNPGSRDGGEGSEGSGEPNTEAPPLQDSPPVSVETNAVAVDPIEVARTNEIAKLTSKIGPYMRARRPGEVSAIIDKLREYDAKLAARYDATAAKIRGERRKSAELIEQLKGGALDGAEAEELVRLYGLEQNATGLVAQAGAMMDDRDLLSPGLALSVAHVAGVAGADELMVGALNEFTSRVTEWQSAEECLAASRLYLERKDRTGCMKLLGRCIEDRPDNAELRLELAAIQAGGTDTKTALKTLKEAINLGGDKIAVAAGKDSRFAPLKDDRSFKRLID